LHSRLIPEPFLATWSPLLACYITFFALNVRDMVWSLQMLDLSWRWSFTLVGCMSQERAPDRPARR
jgi:hypothetical protein